MRKREVCFVIGPDESILWADASDDPIALPDARARWEAIWRLRASIVEIAHTHPLGGARFSAEDESTMEAIDSALGRRVRYAVVTPDAMVRRQGEDEHRVVDEPWWVGLIRLASGVADDHDHVHDHDHDHEKRRATDEDSERKE